MGLGLFSSNSKSCSFSGPRLFSSGSVTKSVTCAETGYSPKVSVAPNPNPYNFEIIDIQENDNFLYLVLKYDGCTTYDGYKVLLYYIRDKKEVLKMLSDKNLDPHFLEDLVSPILRAPHNPEGIALIKKIMEKI